MSITASNCKRPEFCATHCQNSTKQVQATCWCPLLPYKQLLLQNGDDTHASLKRTEHTQCVLAAHPDEVLAHVADTFYIYFASPSGFTLLPACGQQPCGHTHLQHEDGVEEKSAHMRQQHAIQYSRLNSTSAAHSPASISSLIS